MFKENNECEDGLHRIDYLGSNFYGLSVGGKWSTWVTDWQRSVSESFVRGGGEAQQGELLVPIEMLGKIKGIT